MSETFTHYVWEPLRAKTLKLVEPIAPTLNGEKVDAPAPLSLAWIVWLCVCTSIALFLIAGAQGAGRREEGIAPILFWTGVVALLLPIASRIAWPVVARKERLCLLVLLGESMLIYKLLYSPSNLAGFDEMLHWASARDILVWQQLFLPNSLLPISAYYPALEILTTALCNLTGLAIFPASVVVIAVARGIFVAALFLFFERLTSSARLSALATIVYMSCSTFIVFNASFAYESLALMLCVVIGLLESRVGRNRYTHRGVILPLILLACLVVTHHATAIWCVLYLTGLLVLAIIHREETPLRDRIGLTGAIVLGIILTFGTWAMVRGNPIINYLMQPIEQGVHSTVNAIAGTSQTQTHVPRRMFVSDSGQTQPFLNRFLGIGASLLVVIGLSTGFFRAAALAGSGSSGWERLWQVLRFRWTDSRIVLITLGAFGFPLSVVFRLTAGGWEIGNRLNTFVYIPVGLVLAVSIVHFWQPRARTAWIKWGGAAGVSSAIGIILLGAVVIGSGAHAIRGPYRVAADAASIEPMGIEAALWAKNWLGANHIFAADRTNAILLDTYGEQRLSSTITGGDQISRLFFAKTMNNDAMFPIRKGHIEYILADVRLAKGGAEFGEYYEHSETRFSHGKPPIPSSLLKFDKNEKVSRIFDDGYIVIYEVRFLQNDY